MDEDGDRLELEVSGQHFIATQRPEKLGTYDVKWVEGPREKVPTWIDPPYAFTFSSGLNEPIAKSELENASRSFLIGFYKDVSSHYRSLAKFYAKGDPGP